MTFIAWPEIELFHNIRKFIRVDPTEWWKTRELLSGTSTVTYRAKVKLHGTNAAVQVHMDGTVICQSRESIITPEKDNAGFARWVMSNKEAWHEAMGFIIYGEWIGPGIQKNVAVSQIPKKAFAVFAARLLDGSDTLVTEPGQLIGLVEHIPDVYVLPWYAWENSPPKSIDIDWKQSDEELSKTIAPINDWVLAIEANDPWVETVFGVKGTGEGLVFYPNSTPHLGFEHFTNLCFKAKGEKHKNIATAKPVQVSAEVAASLDAFVSMVLTEARLEQGTTKVSADGALTWDMKNTGKFVTWVSADVEKETQDELAASGLTWKEVQKPIADKARAWYLTKAKGF
jgi:hypothetical protein